MSRLDSLAQVSCDTLVDWRNWLAANHQQMDSIWLVRWRKGFGPQLSYADLRDEALCWGWIDGLPRKLDAGRTMVLLSPRRPRSAWSAINRARAVALIAEGRMKPSGIAAIDRSRRDGGWDVLADTDSLAIPGDLAVALQASPPAAEQFGAFAPSSRRAILEWLALAKRPETRARRIAEITKRAAVGLRANFPESRKP